MHSHARLGLEGPVDTGAGPGDDSNVVACRSHSGSYAIRSLGPTGRDFSHGLIGDAPMVAAPAIVHDGFEVILLPGHQNDACGIWHCAAVRRPLIRAFLAGSAAVAARGLPIVPAAIAGFLGNKPLVGR